MMVAAYESTKKAVIVARESGAAREGARGVLRAFSLSTAGRNRLGAVLWDLKYDAPANHAQGFKAAVYLLARTFPIPTSQTLVRVCEVAITEWLEDQCPKCHGRGRTGTGREVIETKRQACRDCRGAGRLFSVSARWANYAEAGALVGNEIPQAGGREGPCEPCGGRGWRQVSEKKNSRLRACLPCRGSGRRFVRDKERARALKMTGELFSKWKGNYHYALRQLRCIDAETAIRVEFRRGRGENPDEAPQRVDILGGGVENHEITEGRSPP